MAKFRSSLRRVFRIAAVAGLLALPIAEARADCWYDWTTVQVGPNGNGIWMKRYCAFGGYAPQSMGWIRYMDWWY